MGLHDLGEFIEAHCPEASKPVELTQLNRPSGRSNPRRPAAGHRMTLAVDVDTCLNRLYGGFYPDWVSGGQWNRMTSFISNLMNACRNANIELDFFVNGALERERIELWHQEQIEILKSVHSVYRHLNNKGTPPPKVWWVAPSCLVTALRMALRAMNIPLIVTFDDHHQEVITYVRDRSLSGLIADHADYAIFDPPRLFSATNLKLTYRGSLETKEYVVDEVAKAIDLHPQRFCVLAALLGTHILPVNDLHDFYCRLCCRVIASELAKVPSADLIRAVIAYVRGVESVDDLDAVGQDVFQNSVGSKDDKIARFKEAVQYYMNGTKEHFNQFLSRKSLSIPTEREQKPQPGSYNSSKTEKLEKPPPPNEIGKNEDSPLLKCDEASPLKSDETLPKSEDSSLPKSADDSLESDFQEYKGDFELDRVYTEAESGYGEQSNVSVSEVDAGLVASIMEEMAGLNVNVQNGKEPELNKKSSEPDENVDASTPAKEKIKKMTKKEKKKPKKERASVSPAVMNVIIDRHSRGLMHPWIYQLFTQAGVKLPVHLEDHDRNNPLPSGVDLYRLLRQNVYAILFDLNKQLAEFHKKRRSDEKRIEKPKVLIREWSVPKGCSSSVPACDQVHAEPLDWLVPGVHRLWLGPGTDDKRRRLRAFLSCMQADFADSLLLNTSFVPQTHIIMCCVLRYMLFCRHSRILLPYELDAFLATSVSPMLSDTDKTQEMKLPMISTRAVHLASLFMQGVDHALFVNDAVGAPIPWGGCCPWLFFDGKLFHMKLLKAGSHNSLIDLCDGRSDQVVQVERMRKAILQGNCSPDQIFARPSLPMHSMQSADYSPYDFIPGGMTQGPVYRGGPPRGRGRGLMNNRNSRPMDNTRGGQLQIAGVVVGNWGGNKHGMDRRSRGRGIHSGPQMQDIHNDQRNYSSHSRGSRGRGRGGRGSRSRGKGPRGNIAPKEMNPGLGRGCTIGEGSSEDPVGRAPCSPLTPSDNIKASSFNCDSPAMDLSSPSGTMLSANLIQNGFHAEP